MLSRCLKKPCRIASQLVSISVCFCLLPAASLGSCSADCQSSWQPDLPEARQPNATLHRAGLYRGLSSIIFTPTFSNTTLPPAPPLDTAWKIEPFVFFLSTSSYLCFYSEKIILVLWRLQMEMLIIKNIVTLFHMLPPLWDLLQLAIMRGETFWWMQLREVFWKLRHREQKGMLLTVSLLVKLVMLSEA